MFNFFHLAALTLSAVSLNYGLLILRLNTFAEGSLSICKAGVTDHRDTRVEL